MPSLPIGTVISLVGGLTLVAAYFIPWFGVSFGGQGVLLSGEVLARLLGGGDEVRRFMPASSALEIRLLRGLIYLFPVTGVLAAALAVLLGFSAGKGMAPAIALFITGLVPLIGLGVGLTRLPPGTSAELGLWMIGVGGLTTVGGVILHGILRGGRSSVGEPGARRPNRRPGDPIGPD